MDTFFGQSLNLDFTAIWTWVLFAARLVGMLLVLPGIGTEGVSEAIRYPLALIIAASVTFSGIRAEIPDDIFQASFMVMTELTLGFVIGLVPSVLIGGLAVSGQVVSGAIGLGQANMIDQSLGGNFAILANIQIKLATIIFLLIDGHHVIIRAACVMAHDVGLGMFRPNMTTVELLISRFSTSFELALLVAAPVLVATLLTQFVLGIITKFVPTVNIFIISLPLSVIVGLYITGHTYPGMAKHIIASFATLEEVVGRMVGT